MRQSLRETHGPTFELLRHFLRRFFDSDLVTSPGQTALAHFPHSFGGIFVLSVG
jgi:hypothetical protein